MSDSSDPLIGLAEARAATQHIKLGTAIRLVPEQNHLFQAKQIATLDRLSSGRFIFGIGARRGYGGSLLFLWSRGIGYISIRR